MKCITVRNMTSAEFLRELALRTQPYNQQPFFPMPDGTIVSQVYGNNFKLWQRNNNGLAPIVEGSIESESSQIRVSWYWRLPLPIMISYSIFALFCLGLIVNGVFAANALMVFGAMIILLGLAGIVFLMCHRSQTPLQAIEDLICNIRAPERLAGSVGA